MLRPASWRGGTSSGPVAAYRHDCTVLADSSHGDSHVGSVSPAATRTRTLALTLTRTLTLALTLPLTRTLPLPLSADMGVEKLFREIDFFPVPHGS